MSEMKIVVTRAPRVRKADYGSLTEGTYYMRQLLIFEADGVFRYELGMKGVPARRVDNQFVLPYDMGLGHASTGNAVVPFDSFEDMCRWVANGRRLEDLQGDCKDEWVQFGSLPLGSIYTCNRPDWPLIKIDNILAMRMDGFTGTLDDTHIEVCKETLVWPVRTDLGDTITIGG